MLIGKRTFLTWAALALALQVHAQDDIGAMRDRMAGLETRLELIQKEIQFETLRRQQEQQRSDAEQLIGGGMPFIVSIGRIDDRWVARLQHSDGIIQSYGVGDLVAPFVRVSDIHERGVTVSKSLASKSVKASGKVSSKASEVEPRQQSIALKFLPVQQTRSAMPVGGVGMPPNIGAALPSPLPMAGR